MANQKSDDYEDITIRVYQVKNNKGIYLGEKEKLAKIITDKLNKIYEDKGDLRLIFKPIFKTCTKCSHFNQTISSRDCLLRDDIGYKGTCIDSLDLCELAENCKYYIEEYD